MSEQVFKDWAGAEYRFNDCVEMTMLPGALADRCGRLVQVRKGVGAYGTPLFLVRRPDGSLHSFENVGIKHLDDETPIDEDDATDVEYTIGGEYPEVGFFVENPRQPMGDSPPFAITVTTSKAR